MKFEIDIKNIPENLDEAISYIREHAEDTLREVSQDEVSDASQLSTQIFRRLVASFAEAELKTVEHLKEYTNT